MTPAISTLEDAGVPFTTYEYEHDGSNRNYGVEAAQVLGIDPSQVFKTLLVSGDDGSGRPFHAVAIVPVSGRVSLKSMGKALGVKRVEMCDPTVAERVTGYVVGGISPFGQRKRLPTVIDEIAMVFDKVWVSGGQRGLEVCVDPADLVSVLDATVADIAGD